MIKKHILLLILMFILGTNALGFMAQEESVQLRVMQLSFIPAQSAMIDIRINNEIAFEGVRFPFTTPYVDLPPGEHTLTTTIVDNTDATASTSFTLEAGTHYTIIVEGDYSEDAVQFIIIDEADLPRDETGSAAVVVNLTPESLDYVVNNEIAMTDIEPEEFRSATLPEGYLSTAVTITGNMSEVLFEQEFTAVPELTLITVLRTSSTGDLQRLFARSSSATIAEYLLSIDGVEPFADAVNSQTSRAVAQSESGAYTFFQPTGDAIDALGDEAPTDPTELEEWVANHITLADLPPYELLGFESLPMLSSNTVSLQFEGTEGGWWEIEGAPIWWDIRFVDGMVYIIDGVIVP